MQDTFIEFCNTSFQIHLQVGAKILSVLQLGTGDSGTGACVGGEFADPARITGSGTRRGLHLFQHAIDTRSLVHKEREPDRRVSILATGGSTDSIMEVLREDAIRFRVFC